MNQHRSTRAVALGGVLAALGICIMCLGSFIGIATYTAPVFCVIFLQVVQNAGGRRLALAWYGAVAVLALLLVMDREAAWLFVLLGYYPILKPWLDKRKAPFLWKGLLFNGSILVLYWLLRRILGLDGLGQDPEQMTIFFLVLLMILGNITFFLLDMLLGMPRFRKLGRYGK